MTDYTYLLEHVRALKRQVLQLENQVEKLEQNAQPHDKASEGQDHRTDLAALQQGLSAAYDNVVTAAQPWHISNHHDFPIDREYASGVRWDNLPCDVLKEIFYSPALPSTSYSHVRLVCNTWSVNFDSTLKTIQLRKLPEDVDPRPVERPLNSRFPSLTEVDLSRLNKDTQRGWPRIARLLVDLAGLSALHSLSFSKECITVSRAVLRQGVQVAACQGHRAPWHQTSADKDYVAALPAQLSALTGLQSLSVLPRALQEGDSRRSNDARGFCSDAIVACASLAGLSRLQNVTLAGAILPAAVFAELCQVTSLSLSSAFQSHAQVLDHLSRFSGLARLSLSKIYNMPTHTRFNSTLSTLTSLQHLDLTDNRLADLPAGLGQLSLLVTLDVSRNKLSRLPELTGLVALTRLTAATNLFRHFPAEVAALSMLQHLDLSLTLLRMQGLAQNDAFQEFCTRPAVETVHLCGVRLQAFPTRLLQLGTLLRLGLSHNHMQQLPPGISQLSNLEHLNIGHNRLVELPSTITTLTRLALLDCKGNMLASAQLPVGSLTYLDLSYNSITDLPANFTSLTKLKYLSLTCNPMNTEGFQLGPLPLLTELQLANMGTPFSGMGHHPAHQTQTQLVALPWQQMLGPGPQRLDLAALSRLEYLNMSANALGRLPPDVPRLLQLSFLNLSRAGLVTLDEAVLSLRGLTYLDLSVNHLQSLPEGASTLRMLRFLDVSSNALEAFPPALWALPCLKQLLACANLLQELPEVPATNKALLSLDVRLNGLQGLPASLSRLVALDELLIDQALETWPAALALKLRRVSVSSSTAAPRNAFAGHRGGNDHRGALPLHLGHLLPFMHPALPDDVLHQMAVQALQSSSLCDKHVLQQVLHQMAEHLVDQQQGMVDMFPYDPFPFHEDIAMEAMPQLLIDQPGLSSSDDDDDEDDAGDAQLQAEVPVLDAAWPLQMWHPGLDIEDHPWGD